MALTTPKMGLRAWDQPSDAFDHDQLADNMAKLDFHDHSPGRGQQIPTEGIRDGAITSAKLSGTISVADGSITTAKLADNAVTTAKIQNLAVTDAKVANSSITGAKLADNSVTAAKIGAGQISLNKMASNSVSTSQIVDESVTDGKIAAANKDGAAGTPSLRTLGTSGNQALPGNHFSTTNQRAPQSPEPSLRIIRGSINGDGAIAYGAGFTITKNAGNGNYTITFSTAFSAVPTVVLTSRPDALSGGTWRVESEAAGSVVVSNPAQQNNPFNFVAIGPA